MWAEVGSSGAVILFIGVFARIFATRVSRVETNCVEQKVYDERQKAIDKSLDDRVKQGSYDERQKAIDDSLHNGRKKFADTEKVLRENSDLLARVDERVGFLVQEWRSFKIRNGRG